MNTRPTPLFLVVLLSALALAAAALGLFACGGGDSGGAASAGSSSSTSSSGPSGSGSKSATDTQGTSGSKGTSGPASTEPSVELPAAAPGTIRGLVVFEGTPPERKPLPGPRKEPGCGEHASDPLTERVIVTNGRLANAFVWVSKLPAGVEVPSAPAEPVVLEQKGCRYAPHVVGVRVGQKLLARNGDETNHNVNAKPLRNTKVNRVQGKGAADIEFVFAIEEIGMPFACDLHPWMNAFVGAVENPWFAVSAEDGSFVLEGLPPGEYTLKCWHENWTKAQTQKATVTADAGAALVFTYRAD